MSPVKKDYSHSLKTRTINIATVMEILIKKINSNEIPSVELPEKVMEQCEEMMVEIQEAFSNGDNK